MIVSIDINSRTALYEQLKDQIISGILENKLTSGEQLPSVRQLSGELEINMHTVSKVYKILENEGFLMINKKKGAFVNVDKSKLKITYEKKALLKEIKLKMALFNNIYESTEEIKTVLREMEDRNE